jgi:secondary thiamine-phosphate synthase enzyme
MAVKAEVLTVDTKGNTDILDITAKVSEIVQDSDLTNGIATLIILGSTAAITTIENESRLLADFKDTMEKVIPTYTNYRHPSNAFAHIRSALFGTSFTVPFADKVLQLGIWQQIVLIDFDNRPRSREITIQMVGE